MKISDIEKILKYILKNKKYTLRIFCHKPKVLPKSFYNDIKRYFYVFKQDENGDFLEDENGDFIDYIEDYKNFDEKKAKCIIYRYCKHKLGIYPKYKDINQDGAYMTKYIKILANEKYNKG